jgi:hypothetical protein
MARLIAAGESEHLADAELTFQITFGLIRDRINQLAASGREFSGPTEEAALAVAMRCLDLPPALGNHGNGLAPRAGRAPDQSEPPAG